MAILLGANGSGKTVLLKLILGLLRPDSGQTYLNGSRIDDLGEHDLLRIRADIGMLFQENALFDSLTGGENVGVRLGDAGDISPDASRQRVEEVLAFVGLAEFIDRMPATLSGGQRKRVGLARGLMLDPQILIYDEPTSGLDPPTSRMVDDLIEETRDRFGVTSVVISHDMASTFRIAHKAFLVIQGRVVAEGSPDELAFGDSEVAREFIAASGIGPDRISRVGRPAENKIKTEAKEEFKAAQ